MATIYKVKCTSINKDGCEEEYFMDYVNAENRVTQLLNRDLDKELRGRRDIALTSIRRLSVASMNKAAYWLTGRIKRRARRGRAEPLLPPGNDCHEGLSDGNS